SQFSFQGPLPSRLAISVVTSGAPEITGPDFRSPPIAASDIDPSTRTRVEVVLGPIVQIGAAEITAWVADALTPQTGRLRLLGGAATAEISVTGCQAASVDGAIKGTINGQVSLQGPMGIKQSSPFSIGVSIALVPSVAPASDELCDLIKGSVPEIQLPGIAGQYL